jgi:hypothetical protein
MHLSFYSNIYTFEKNGIRFYNSYFILQKFNPTMAVLTDISILLHKSHVLYQCLHYMCDIQSLGKA